MTAVFIDLIGQKLADSLHDIHKNARFIHENNREFFKDHPLFGYEPKRSGQEVQVTRTDGQVRIRFLGDYRNWTIFLSGPDMAERVVGDGSTELPVEAARTLASRMVQAFAPLADEVVATKERAAAEETRQMAEIADRLSTAVERWAEEVMIDGPQRYGHGYDFTDAALISTWDGNGADLGFLRGELAYGARFLTTEPLITYLHDLVTNPKMSSFAERDVERKTHLFALTTKDQEVGGRVYILHRVMDKRLGDWLGTHPNLASVASAILAASRPV